MRKFANGYHKETYEFIFDEILAWINFEPKDIMEGEMKNESV